VIFSGDCVRIAVTELTQVGEVRRVVGRLAAASGFDQTTAGKASLIATELANNLVKYGRHTGEFLVQRIHADGGTGLELIAVDKGPGIADLSRSLVDGFSTSGTPGTGLGAVQRAADSFQVQTKVDKGSIFVARLWSKGPLSNGRWGAISVPIKGEQVCGDRWAAVEANGRLLFMLADGLGHGVGAAEASEVAVATLHERSNLRPGEILDFAHRAMRSTRGAAVAVAAIDLERGLVEYAGVGNISASIIANAGTRHMVSHNGTLGHEVRKIQEFSYPWEEEATLIMHSDGLGTRWGLNEYTGTDSRPASVLAALLYRDHARAHDDTSVIVLRGKTSR